MKNRLLHLALSLHFVLLTACRTDTKPDTPDFDEGKTLAHQAAVVLESTYRRSASDFVNVFLGSARQRNQALSREMEGILTEEMRLFFLAAFHSAHPVYHYDANYFKKQLLEWFPDNMEAAYPIGESVDTYSGLTMNFDFEGTYENPTMALSLSGVLNLCEQSSEASSSCEMQVDMNFRIYAEGQRWGLAQVGNLDSSSFEKRSMNVEFSGTISNDEFRMSLSDGLFHAPKRESEFERFDWYLIQEDKPDFIDFGFRWRYSTLHFKTHFTRIEGAPSYEIEFPVFISSQNTLFEAAGDLYGSTPSPIALTQFHLNNFKLRAGPITLEKADGTRVSSDINVASDFELTDLSLPNWGPCNQQPGCYQSFFSTFIDLLTIGDLQGIKPALKLSGEFGFHTNSNTELASNQYERTAQGLHRWTISENYLNHIYTANIERNTGYTLETFRIYNKDGAEISASFDESGLLVNSHVSDRFRNTLGSVIEIGGELVVQFEDGTNLNLGR